MARLSDSYPRDGGVTHSIETYREALGFLRRPREQGKIMGKSLYCGFHGKEGARQRKQFRTG